VTNGDGAQQRAKLQNLGLVDRFNVFLASGDVGFPKPDKRIFETAAARLGVARNTASSSATGTTSTQQARSQLGCAGFG